MLLVRDRPWYMQVLLCYDTHDILSRCKTGFITNTRKLKVTPEIAARLRRGEQVSPEEIDAAVRAAEAKTATAETPVTNTDTERESDSTPRRMTRSAMKKKASNTPSKHIEESKSAESSANEWIPETHLKKTPQRRSKR